MRALRIKALDSVRGGFPLSAGVALYVVDKLHNIPKRGSADRRAGE